MTTILVTNKNWCHMDPMKTILVKLDGRTCACCAICSLAFIALPRSEAIFELSFLMQLQVVLSYTVNLKNGTVYSEKKALQVEQKKNFGRSGTIFFFFSQYRKG